MSGPRFLLGLFLTALLLYAASAAQARGRPVRTNSPDWLACGDALARAQAGSGIPAGLLAAVAISESGRPEPDGRGRTSWPWAVNASGQGHYFPSKEAAIAFVESEQLQGRDSIDVGCMQINLRHHPDAFESLEEAFEPSINVAYGARFLRALHAETGSWEAAVGRYHTAEPVRGRAYQERVFAAWGREPDRRLARPGRIVTAALGIEGRGGRRRPERSVARHPRDPAQVRSVAAPRRQRLAILRLDAPVATPAAGSPVQPLPGFFPLRRGSP